MGSFGSTENGAGGDEEDLSRAEREDRCSEGDAEEPIGNHFSYSNSRVCS